MEEVDGLAVLRLVSAILVLGYASVLDWRTRRVGNAYWIALTTVGLFLLIAQLLIEEKEMAYLLVIVPILAILSDVYWDVEGEGKLSKIAPAVKYAVALISMVFLGLRWGSNEYFQFLLAVPLMMLFIVLMYMLDVIRGGADAKALMALTVLFPLYPYLNSFPLLRPESTLTELVFPFSLVVLVNATILVALLPLVFLTKNAMEGNLRFPQALFGYKTRLDAVEDKFVWLMERIEGERHVIYTRPKRTEDLGREVRLLRQAGVSQAWVTPKVPFLIPITAGLVLSTVVGNFLLVLFLI